MCLLCADVCVFRTACVFQFLGAERLLLNCQNHPQMLTWGYCQWPHYVNKGYFKKYKRCGIYFLRRGRGQRENECVRMNGLPLQFFSYIPHSSIRSNWPTLCPLFASWSNAGLWFVCLAHPCMQGNAALPPEELLTSILGCLSAQNGHSLHRLSNETPASHHLTAEVCQRCSSVLPSLEPALVRLESEVVWETELAKKSCYEEKKKTT